MKAGMTVNKYPNTIGVHALVWTGQVDADSLGAAARQSKAAGYDLLELSLHDIEEMDFAASRAAFAEAGVEIACSRGLAHDADVSSEDPAIVDRGVGLLVESIEATAAMGGTILTGALYSAFGKAAQPLSAKGRENIVSALRTVAEHAVGFGVTLGLEVCNRYETNVLNTARQAIALADDIDADNIMIHLDSYHMNIEEPNQVRPILEAGDRLGYIHIGENNRGFLGSGIIDFATHFWALQQIGYEGPITFESFSSAIVSKSLSNDLAIWRNLWDDNVQLATLARYFIDNGLVAAATAALR
ncbi:sugar phosphate isomerase/epimerase family protein [Microbacterium sp. YY-01]|uniref:sugar phosphate isomerase/epimerase family protein n=1 Tax=Microbacterium sp. YY-01 TaxID=3421634 RepID=UPI003D176CB9